MTDEQRRCRKPWIGTRQPFGDYPAVSVTAAEGTSAVLYFFGPRAAICGLSNLSQIPIQASRCRIFLINRDECVTGGQRTHFFERQQMPVGSEGPRD
jgi:hypothetical protein